MTTYARLENNVVVELLNTAADPAHMFNPLLQWKPVSTPGVAIGWIAGDLGFGPPPAALPSAPLTPSLVQLQSDLAALTARFAAFTTHAGG